MVVDVVDVDVVVDEPVTPEVSEEPGVAPADPPLGLVLLVPPVPVAPMELVPEPGVAEPDPLAVVSELVLPVVPPVAPAVLEVGGVVVDGLVAADGAGVVVVVDVVLSVLSFFVQAPSDRAATTVNTAAAVWVRDVFMIGETPSDPFVGGRGSFRCPNGAL